jgi:hypothetical protein
LLEANLDQQPGSRDAFAAISPVRALGASWQADAGGGAHAHLQVIRARP